MNEPAFYMRMLAVPSPDEQRALAALLSSRLRQIEQLQRHKLDAIAALLWQLSGEGGGGGGGGAAALPAGVERLLSRYLEDGTGEERWVPPVAREAEPERLRADLLDFARSQLTSQVKSKAAGGAGTKPGITAASKRLSGRAVARIFHKVASPAFPRKRRCGGPTSPRPRRRAAQSSSRCGSRRLQGSIRRYGNKVRGDKER